jgi:cation transport ATPase
MSGANPKHSSAAVEDQFAPVTRSDSAEASQPESSAQGHGDEEHAESRVEWVRVGFVAMVLLAVWSGRVPRVHGLDLLALTGIAIGGYPIFKEAFADLLKLRMTMELSMTIALVAASVIGELFTALLITLFVLVAEIIEGMTVGRGRSAIRRLLDLLPQTVEVRSNGKVSARALLEVHVGDVVLVRPGGPVPVDGVVVNGHSFIDQATITGESIPAEKVLGSHVFAGTINQTGVLEIHAEKIGQDTAFGRIIELVERAEHSRARLRGLRTGWPATWSISPWPVQR